MSDLQAARQAVAALKAGLRVRAFATGRSMTPGIQPGDWLEVEPSSAWHLDVGDIAVYHSSDAGPEEPLTTHRVIGKGFDRAELYLETRSDAQGWSGVGEEVPASAVLGRVVAIGRASGGVVPLSGWRRRCDRWRVLLRLAAGRFKRAFSGRAPAKTDSKRRYIRQSVLQIGTQDGETLYFPVRDGVVDACHLVRLNATATYLWEQLEDPGTPEDLAARMRSEFHVESVDVRQDVLDALAQLEAEGLVKREPAV